MRIAEVNMVHYGSTARIMYELADVARREGHEVLTLSPKFYKKGGKPCYPPRTGHKYFGFYFENMLHHHISRVIGFDGFFSVFGTLELIWILYRYNPDVIHLHNLHNWTFNIPILFTYLKKRKVQVVWTLHDCWAFTGQCSHFENEKCEKWKNGCYKCTRLNVYPNSLMDSTAFQWKVKKNLFGKMERLTIVTPSVWLKEQVKLSFLKDKRIEVINNGIDLNVFRPRKSDFRSIYGIEDKYVILGVAFDWGYRKGLDVFCYLAEHLDESFAIVLVGTSDSIDKSIPDRIVSIHRTDNIEQLVEIYTASDLFLNPTREDTFPTVNIEALACGLPVMTFSTGGSPEIINENCGSIIASNKACEVLKAVNAIKINKAFKDSKCIQNARKYSKEEKFEEYLKLYEDCTHCS